MSDDWFAQMQTEVQAERTASSQQSQKSAAEQAAKQKAAQGRQKEREAQLRELFEHFDVDEHVARSNRPSPPPTTTPPRRAASMHLASRTPHRG